MGAPLSSGLGKRHGIERVRCRAVRLGILIGAGLGVPLSYFVQPVSVRTVEFFR